MSTDDPRRDGTDGTDRIDRIHSSGPGERADPEVDLVGDDEAPEGVEQLPPLKGLMDPEREGAHSPASDADVPAPPG